MDTAEELHTRDEISSALNRKVSANAILKATQRGEITFYRVGGRHLYRLRDIEAWLEGRRKLATVALGGRPLRATPRSAARRSRDAS